MEKRERNGSINGGIRKEVSDPHLMELPSEKEIRIKKIKVVLIFYAGYNEKLNNNLIL